jgi:hypothetical protein
VCYLLLGSPLGQQIPIPQIVYLEIFHPVSILLIHIAEGSTFVLLHDNTDTRGRRGGCRGMGTWGRRSGKRGWAGGDGEGGARGGEGDRLGAVVLGDCGGDDVPVVEGGGDSGCCGGYKWKLAQ